MRKLHRPWTGPYRVLRKLSDVNYRIQDVQAPRRRPVVHFDRLKYCPPDIQLPHLQQTRGKRQRSHNVMSTDKKPLPRHTELTIVDFDDNVSNQSNTYDQSNVNNQSSTNDQSNVNERSNDHSNARSNDRANVNLRNCNEMVPVSE